MDFKDFIEKMSDVLEISQPLTGEETLEEIENWDSLKLLSFIAFADHEFGQQLNMPELQACLTLCDLYRFLLKESPPSQ
jgi:acyl carrier protein